MSSVLVLMFAWGVYLITPLIVDGIDTLRRLTIVKRHRAKHKNDPAPDDDDYHWPTITIIVPCHNEAEVIDRCLTSVKNQDYPADRLEIVVVDDGSTDGTATLVESHVNGFGAGNPMKVRSQRVHVGKFEGKVALIKRDHGGKSQALNAGIAQSTGEIIVNIDSDVVLAPDAVRHIALTFLRYPHLDAATGNIQIDWEIIEDRDDEGHIILDEHGDIVPRKLGWFELLLAKCQFLEYLASFDLGRRSQAITSSMYTLAGACSAYRRSFIVSNDIRYSSVTVSEDTALTFDLHRNDGKIGFMPGANVHLEPVTDLDALYGQRVRWARGQLEVSGMNRDLLGAKESTIGHRSLPKMMIYDHTLAFPRLIWGPLFLCFGLIGYTERTIAFALVAMYMFYVLIEILHVLSSYAVSDEFIKSRVDQCGWAVLAMPLYRLVVFYYRFSGFLATLNDEQKWTASGPIQTTRQDFERLRLRTVQATTLFGTGLTRMARVAGSITGIPFVALVVALARFMHLWRDPKS